MSVEFNRKASTDPLLQSFLDMISGLKSEIQTLILFGSRARGDEKPDSDYDLLLVVKARTPSLEASLYDAVLDTLFASGRLISLKIFTQADYERLNRMATPFMQRVRAEGVVIG